MNLTPLLAGFTLSSRLLRIWCAVAVSPAEAPDGVARSGESAAAEQEALFG